MNPIKKHYNNLFFELYYVLFVLLSFYRYINFNDLIDWGSRMKNVVKRNDSFNDEWKQMAQLIAFREVNEWLKNEMR